MQGYQVLHLSRAIFQVKYFVSVHSRGSQTFQVTTLKLSIKQSETPTGKK